ncbi:hypothetical protein MNBD_ACTINO01-427 [hydrothermal vent metagenome]|uniref:Class E sortase n=1 Tax=hydrothermal vent metagenome TaxID=652676 RepID=A0A3B0T675_9ZZZZ
MSNATEHEVITDRPPAPKTGRVTKIIRTIGWTSIGLGLFLVGFVVHQLFITTYFAQQNNETLKVEAAEYFEEVTISEVEYVAPGAPDVTDPQDPAAPVEPTVPEEPKTLLVEETPQQGEAFAIIRIPSIERLAEGWTVVQGVSRSDLKNGVGHMPSTPLPGQPGNAVLPGHRTTYGAPFHELDELEVGDIIEVETAIGLNIYEVRESIIVRPTEIWVTNPRPGSWITLSTCNPKFSSRERLIIFAELVSGPNYDVIYNS